MAPPLPPERLPARAALALAALVTLRFGLGAARFAATPARFRNFEESYNATVAWLLGHGTFLGDPLTLQYRSFCGGCTVNAVLGAPLLAGDAELWRWKLLPLLWTAATQLVGFFALDAWVGRAAAWGFVLLFAVPPLGALDLSLMAWGNHQESAFFAVLALWCVARGRGAAAGFVLGFAIWFVRTAAYEAVVLLPLALTLRGQRLRTLAGFAAGFSLLGLPAAGGDAGWYRMDEAIGIDSATLLKRAATLFAPGQLAGRLWLPFRDMAPAGGLLLGLCAVAGFWAARDRRARVVALLPLAYAAAYCGTRFPIFLISAKVPVNNLRYHAPWVFSLTLLVGVGVGVAWAAGKRRRAAAVAAGWVLVNGFVLARVPWSPDPTAGSMSALDLPLFVATATPRFAAEALDEVDRARGREVEPVEGAAAATRARMRGLVLGHEVRTGARAPADAVARLGGANARYGFGEAAVAPCASVAEAEAALAVLPVEERPEARRGAALTLSFCDAAPPLEAWTMQLGSTPEGAGYASALGRALVDRCQGVRSGAGAAPPEPARFAACLSAAVEGLPFADEAIFGAGRAWADPVRDAAELPRVAAALGRRGPAFEAGAADLAAGTHQPPFAREAARPGSPP